MEYCRSLSLPVIEHAEDVSLAAGAVMRRRDFHSAGFARDAGGGGVRLRGARRTAGGTYRRAAACRASLGEGLAGTSAVGESRGLAVTCEVTPHHFTLIDEDVTYDSRFKMNPPLPRARTGKRYSRGSPMVRSTRLHRSRAARAGTEGRGIRQSALWEF